MINFSFLLANLATLLLHGLFGGSENCCFKQFDRRFFTFIIFVVMFLWGFLSKRCLLCNFSIDLNIFEMEKSSDLKLIKNRLQKKKFSVRRENYLTFMERT